MDLPLPSTDRIFLRELQRNERYKREYVKVTFLLMLDMNFSHETICTVLGIDQSTGYRYVKDIESNADIDAYLGTGNVGYMGKLNSEQLSELKAEVRTNLYHSAEDVGLWIAKTYGVNYSKDGVVELLHRLSFSWKKTSPTPQSASVEAQKKFVKQLRTLRRKASDDAVFLFGDSCHPYHNTRSRYAWIETGKEHSIPANSGRFHANINAVMNADDPCDVTARFEKTVNAQSTIELYKDIEKKYPKAKTIYIVRDNARYYCSKVVTEYLKHSRIMELPLPPYAPNLNIIERLWKFMRKKVIDSIFYQHSKDFLVALTNFFINLDIHRKELSTLMTLKFDIIGV